MTKRSQAKKSAVRRPAPPAAEQNSYDRTAFLAAVDEGLADAKAGRTVPYAKVRRWLLSWGSDLELPPPRPVRKHN